MKKMPVRKSHGNNNINSIAVPAARKDFWEFLISRHPLEENHAPSTKHAFRWRNLSALRLVIGQFVSEFGVGVYVRGEKGANADQVEHRLHPHAEKLKKELGADNFFIVASGNPRAKFFFHKFKNFNSSNRNNWAKMADWLHTEADAYQKTLQQVLVHRDRTQNY
jgi:hypothetical protein